MFRIVRLVNNIQRIKSRNISSSSFMLSYKSDLSQETLYPNSKQKLFTPSAPSSDGNTFSGYIPIDKLVISYDRSSGPGGQNVNKLSTKVDLRFHVKTAEWITEAVRQRIQEDHKTRINKEGFMVIKSDLTRYQQMNLADALEKLRTIVRNAEKPKKIELSSETLEKIRKKKENAARERVIIKRQKSETKSQRQAPIVN